MAARLRPCLNDRSMGKATAWTRQLDQHAACDHPQLLAEASYDLVSATACTIYTAGVEATLLRKPRLERD